jgi:hypothetical protein
MLRIQGRSDKPFQAKRSFRGEWPKPDEQLSSESSAMKRLGANNDKAEGRRTAEGWSGEARCGFAAQKPAQPWGALPFPQKRAGFLSY